MEQDPPATKLVVFLEGLDNVLFFYQIIRDTLKISGRRLDKISLYLDSFQINPHRASAPSVELKLSLSKKAPIICFIQEPFFRHGKVQRLNRKHDQIMHFAGSERIRSCLYIFKYWNVHPLYHLSTKEIAVAVLMVEQCGNDTNIVICSVFFSFRFSLLRSSNCGIRYLS